MRIRFAATAAGLTMAVALTGIGASAATDTTGVRTATDRTTVNTPFRSAESAVAPAALRCPRGTFCAYIHANYSGELMRSSAGRGSRVQVSGGTSSGSNNTGNQWVGVNEIPGPDDDVWKWAPYSEGNVSSAANDKINHFDVK
ncbi:peptidase inhibitor family I36 protein [Streptomyces sp. NBC_01498]|uniref:peptidase inhibitor family I36 protein n=1 Tax=Streptomyces sp. NBC_01498 TaxID=2975870 RepID=UPI002E7BE047|nr:peptidase inhibitor family I36 protein [Streptomyces sp. NBC_01498]WTL27678.1 peptidase inhibitor family I36 protein [Streptomyces sp. NBC_01498]